MSQISSWSIVVVMTFITYLALSARSEDGVKDEGNMLRMILSGDGTGATAEEFQANQMLLQNILSEMRGNAATDPAYLSRKKITGNEVQYFDPSAVDLGLGRGNSGRWIGRYTAALHDSLSPSGPGKRRRR